MTLEGYVSQHDKYQIEMKFTFPVNTGKKWNDYHIDAFFFLPRNLAVNLRTYPAERFYRNMYEYIRFKTPVIRLRRLACPDNQPLLKLKNALRELKQEEAYTEQIYMERLKMFCSIVKSVLRNGELHVSALPDERIVTAAEEYLHDSGQIIAHFRALRKHLDKVAASETHREIFDWVDEFIGITANSYRYRLYNQLESRGASINSNTLKKRIAALTGHEIKYRKSRNYPSIPDPGGGNSELLYRESTLKKTMASVLYLKLYPRRAGIWLENFFYGLAAAVAMSSALGILFIWKGLSLGEFSLAFFILYVVSYILREQIKRSMQGFFAEKRSRYSCDYRKIIRDNMNHTVGACNEKFGFSRETAIPAEIARLRNRSSLSKLENESRSEEIMEFHKEIALDGNYCERIFQDFKIDGVVDILRFNIRGWLDKMDNPGRRIFCPDPEHNDKIIAIRGHRVYHVNLLLRFGARHSPDQYARYRLILSRNGIRAVEPVPLEP